MELTGAEILVKSLEQLKVTHVFGYPGATILPVFHALAKAHIQIIVNSNEQSCAFSAAGFSRSSDRVGVAIVTSRPAITNTLTAVADCNVDSVPVLVVAGQVPQRKLGSDEFQHINVTEVFAKASKKVILITDNSDVETVVKDAYFLARSGKPGPVVIDFPLDAQRKMAYYKQQDPDIYRLKYEDESHLGRNQCREFFQLLQGARRPLLYIGGGLNSRAASEKIREFNHLFNMFGVRWDDRVTQRVGDPGLEANIAYFDINAEKVQEVRVTREPKFSFIGDAKIALEDLVEYAKENNIKLNIKEWQERASYLKRAFQLNYNRNAESIQQAEVMDLLSSLLTEQTKITTGVGNHQMLAAQYLKILQPKSFFAASGFGTMGFALPCAIGVHYANSEATVIAIDGDSSIKMNMGEIHTIGSLGLPIKVLLLNNHGDGMVRNIQDADYQQLHTATERSFDANFAQIAKECGFTFCRKIKDRQDLEPGLREMLGATGPSFLEIVTDRNEMIYPRIPIGKGYRDMILGPFIRKTLAS